MKKGIKSLIMVFMVLAFLLSACSKKDTKSSERNSADNYSKEYETEAPDTAMDDDVSYTTEIAEDAVEEAQYALPEEADFESKSLTSTTPITPGSYNSGQDKIIRTISMDIETINFTDLTNTISNKINQLGGYVESSEITGDRIYQEESELKHGEIIARIPKEHMDEFVQVVGKNASVVNRSENTENVSLKYTDIQSRKKALEIEQERLFSFLEKVETLEDMMTLESRLSDIRYELQNFETELRTYDNKVEYGTVSMSINEVESLTPPVKEEKEKTPSTWSRIKTGFGDTMHTIGNALQDFLVFIVVNLPYFIIAGILIAAAILIPYKCYKKSIKKINNQAINPNVVQDHNNNQ